MDLEMELDKMVTAEMDDAKENEFLKQFQAFIHPDLLSEYMGCGHCTFTGTPDIVAVHLIDKHNYNILDTQVTLTTWEDTNFEYDEDGYPALKCSCGLMYMVRDGQCYDCKRIGQSD